jgi:hypothetical protein
MISPLIQDVYTEAAPAVFTFPSGQLPYSLALIYFFALFSRRFSISAVATSMPWEFLPKPASMPVFSASSGMT